MDDEAAKKILKQATPEQLRELIQAAEGVFNHYKIGAYKRSLSIEWLGFALNDMGVFNENNKP